MEITNQQDEQDEDMNLRQQMIERLKLSGRFQTQAVGEVFRLVPRHLFVPEVDLKTAYSDIPVATRWQDGQAISSSSAPSVMAIMLEMLAIQPGQRILEIGAGTGYNAALMAQLVGKQGRVVTVDLDEDIVRDARVHLRSAGIENVEVVCGDGSLGWAEGAPYDHVILTASAADIFPAWWKQLHPGGRLVLPLQILSFNSKLAEPPRLPDHFLLAFTWTGSSFTALDLCPCGFMPLRGDFAQKMYQTTVSQPETGLSALLPAEIEAQSLFGLLKNGASEETTPVHLSFQEIYGLRLWLALRDPRYCEVYVPDGTPSGTISAQLRRDQTFAAAIGLCDGQTACLLSLQEEESGQVVDPQHPFHLAIRRFGPDRALAAHLREEVTAWEQAGHPLVWGLDGRMKDLSIRACPVVEIYTPQAHETVLTRRHTRFIFTPQYEKSPLP